jgi:hypothetical protein
MSQNEQAGPLLDRIQRLALIAGVAGLVLCGVGAFLDLGQFYASYLFAYMFWLGIALGSMAIMFLYNLVGGAWGFTIRRIAEAAAMTLPLMLLLFLPIAVDLLSGSSRLYEWARPEAANDPIIQAKAGYLNVPFFLLRALIYFVIWIGLAYLLNRWSLEQDRTADPAPSDRLRLLGRYGLAAYILTLTFASIDWVMSVEPHWFSSIFGVLFLAGQGLSSMAFATAAAGLLSRREPLARVATLHAFNDLGNLMLAFVMFWAYINLSQYLIIWSGNLPEEVPWYLHRTQGGWVWVIRFVLAFQFVAPLLLLFSRRTKRNIQRLSTLAAALLGVHLVEMFWRVVPSFRLTGLAIYWTDIVAPIAVGGIWIAALIWLLKRRPLVALHDPRAPVLREQLEHGSATHSCAEAVRG